MHESLWGQCGDSPNLHISIGIDSETESIQPRALVPVTYSGELVHFWLTVLFFFKLDPLAVLSYGYGFQ